MSIPTSGEQPLDTALLEQPRTVKILIAMYEGLARSCDDMSKKANQSPPDTNAQKHLKRYRRMYEKRVGVDFTERERLSRAADLLIEQDAS